MRNIAFQAGISDNVLQTIWSRTLPQRIQEIISVSETTTDLTKLAKLTDKFAEGQPSSSYIDPPTRM